MNHVMQNIMHYSSGYDLIISDENRNDLCALCCSEYNDRGTLFAKHSQHRVSIRFHSTQVILSFINCDEGLKRPK
jgi:hypothetical protein